METKNVFLIVNENKRGNQDNSCKWKENKENTKTLKERKELNEKI